MKTNEAKETALTMTGNLSDLSLDDLTTLFNKFLLSAFPSFSSAWGIARAYQFDLPVLVTGEKSLRYGRTIRLLRHLNVRFEEVEYSALIKHDPFLWSRNSETSDIRILVCDNKYEEYNLGVLLQFYVALHSERISQKNPGHFNPRFTAPYLLMLWSVLIRQGEKVLSNRILHDLLSSLPDRDLSVWEGMEMRGVYERLTSIEKTAAMYLGFCSGNLKTQCIEIPEKLSKHALNVMSSNRISAQSIAAIGSSHFGRNLVSFPFYVREYLWPADQFGTVASNAVFLSKYSGTDLYNDKEQADSVLRLRLKGLSDVQIAQESGFGSTDELAEWLSSHRINHSPQPDHNPYREWLSACKIIGITPEVADVAVDRPVWATSEHEDTVKRSSDAGVKVVQVASLPGSKPVTKGFRFSPDFRSVRSEDDKPFTLSSKQAEVIQLLHSMNENGTPEIAQSTVISEVFPKSTDTKLKRLFDYDEAYDALVQQGVRKGLVKLKVSLT
jgi:hypothetical protein